MRILMVSAEFAPFAKSGGLADAVAGLFATLKADGHDVRVVTPAYAGRYPEQQRAIPKLQVTLPSHTEVVSLYQLPSVADVTLIDHPSYRTPQMYQGDTIDIHKFALLAGAAIAYCQLHQWSPDVIHCHDWHSALLPHYLKRLVHWDELFANTRSVLTIHNWAYQGCAHENWRGLVCNPDPQDDHLNFLLRGVREADCVSTVSEGYAQDLRQAGIDQHLAGKPLIGIVNGIDPRVWNPAKDPHLDHRYCPDSWQVRRASNKAALKAKLGLADNNLPLFGFVSRFVHQKGVDLLLETIDPILQGQAGQFVVLGSGDESLVQWAKAYQDKYPTLFAFYEGFDEPLSHQIFAATDFTLVPSRFEPCGLTQLYAMSYGSVPIVRGTGGLKDTVVDLLANESTGRGIVFHDFDPQAMAWAFSQALQLYSEPKRMAKVITNGMAQDFSWQSRPYLQLYQQLIGAKLDQAA